LFNDDSHAFITADWRVGVPVCHLVHGLGLAAAVFTAVVVKYGILLEWNFYPVLFLVLSWLALL